MDKSTKQGLATWLVCTGILFGAVAYGSGAMNITASGVNGQNVTPNQVTAITVIADGGVFGAETVGTITSTSGSGVTALQMTDLAKVSWSNTNIQGNGTSIFMNSNGTSIITLNRTGPQADVVAGTGLTAVNLGGNLTTNVTPVASSGAGSTLMTYSLPGNTLTTSARCLYINAWGHATNDANAKTVSLAFGTTTTISKQLNVSLAGQLWRLNAVVCRTGSSAQQIYAEGWNDNAIAVSGTDGPTILYHATQTSATETETAGITIKGVATTATTTGITQDGMQVMFQ